MHNSAFLPLLSEIQYSLNCPSLASSGIAKKIPDILHAVHPMPSLFALIPNAGLRLAERAAGDGKA